MCLDETIMKKKLKVFSSETSSTSKFFKYIFRLQSIKVAIFRFREFSEYNRLCIVKLSCQTLSTYYFKN